MKFKLIVFYMSLCCMFSNMALADETGSFEKADFSEVESSEAYLKKISKRFDVSEQDVLVISIIAENPSDIYMILRMAELSQTPIEDVLTLYQWQKKKGWGAIAKQLGIKPGSEQFKQIGRPDQVASKPVASDNKEKKSPSKGADSKKPNNGKKK